MNTTAREPSFFRDWAVSESPQRDLFGDAEAPPTSGSTAGLFAEVVFDRPLDHAYTYAVPEHLQAEIAVGKRILVPFGRGDKSTIGYCVRLNKTAPDRPVKEVRHVL